MSTARRELPSLFDVVTGRDGATVVIARRDGGPEAVLVGRAYIERLERASRLASTERPFRLAGSIRAVVDDPIGQLRESAGAEAEKRLASLVPRARRAR